MEWGLMYQLIVSKWGTIPHYTHMFLPGLGDHRRREKKRLWMSPQSCQTIKYSPPRAWRLLSPMGPSINDVTIFPDFLTPPTNFGHTKTKSLILCGPNSNSIPVSSKYLLGRWIKRLVFSRTTEAHFSSPWFFVQIKIE